MEGTRGRVVILLLVFAYFCTVESANKYTKDLNMKHNKRANKTPEGIMQWEEKAKSKIALPVDRHPFRSHKVNMVWEKAQKRLPEFQLMEIMVDLKIQDKLEMELKKKRVEGQDQDGEIEAYTRTKMNDILQKYGLSPKEDDNRIKEENETIDKDGVGIKTDSSTDGMKFHQDKKLEKLWRKAKASGFTDDQLIQLEREFQHHEDKVNQFMLLKNEIDVMDGLSDNSVEGMKRRGALPDMKEKRKEHKSRHKEMLDSYQYLEDITNKMLHGQVEFDEPRVLELWKMAKMSNMTDVELQSFKEELKHFDHKIKKHEYLKTQAEQTREQLPPHKSNSAAKKEKVEDMEQKVMDYGYKVKKIHTELKTRMAKTLGIHSEL